MQKHDRKLRACAAILAAVLSPALGAAVVNGDFESGDTGFMTDYMTGDCLNLLQCYGVATSPNNVNHNYASFGDHTTGTGMMMVVNGAETADQTVWQQTVSVTANTAYEFSAWIASAYFLSPAGLEFSVNGSLVGSMTAPLPTGTWQQAVFAWNSGAATTAVLRIVDANLDYTGNDFVLDDIGFSQVVPIPAAAWLFLSAAGLLGCARNRGAAT